MQAKLPITLASFFLLTFSLFFLFSCQKDEFAAIPMDKSNSVLYETDVNVSKEIFEGNSIPFDKQDPTVARHLNELAKRQSSRDAYFNWSQIKPEVNTTIESDSSDFVSYSFLLPTIDFKTDKFYNLIYEKIDGEFEDPYILEFEFNSDYEQVFNVTNLDMFEGWIRKYALEAIIENNGRGELTVEFCYELFFGDSGGGHGIFTNQGEVPPSDNPTVIFGPGGGFLYCLVCVECTGADHTCGQACKCTDPRNHCVPPRWELQGCGQDRSAIGGRSGQGRGDLEDCLNILLAAGVTPPGQEGGQGDPNQNNEDCPNKLKEDIFILSNYFSDNGLASNGIDISPCCNERNFDNCAWNEHVSEGYDLNFSLDDYKDYVVPFLEKFGMVYDDLDHSGIDLNECVGSSDFESCLLGQLAQIKHDYLSYNYRKYQEEGVDLESFINVYGADHYLAAAELYEGYMLEIGDPPSDEYQWQLAMEVFREEMLPILAELTPGIGDFIGAYNDFKQGSYFWGCVGIISAVVPGDEIFKVIRKAKSIKKAWKNVKKIFTLWNKLFSTVGGQKILNKMPQSWKDLPGSKLADGDGLYWKKDQFNNIRVMDGVPNSPFPNSQVPYTRVTKNGSRLDKFGNPVDSNNPNFEALTHIPLAEVTDQFLDKFFN